MKQKYNVFEKKLRDHDEFKSDVLQPGYERLNMQRQELI